MSFPIDPQAQDSRATMRSTARCGLQVTAVLLYAGACIFGVIRHHHSAFSAGETLGLAGLVLLSLYAAMVIPRTGLRVQRNVEALRAQQQRLMSVVEEIGVGIWESQVGSGEVIVSASWARIAGMSSDPGANHVLSAGQWRELSHPDDLLGVDRVIAQCHATRSGAQVFRLDYRMRHKAGHWVWVASRGMVADRAADGAPLRVVGTITDITARKLAELALESSEKSYRALVEQLPVGIALSDLRTRRLLLANAALVASCGYTREELLAGMTIEQLTAPVDDNSAIPLPARRERDFMRKDGKRYAVQLSGTRMMAADGREVVWSVVQDMSERKAVERQLAVAVRRDRLTGLANRTQFMERLQEAVDRVHARQQAMFAVLFLDFDRFKVVNDAMGHQAGDELLVQIADRMRTALRTTDADAGLAARNQIARFGGDEFLVLINDIHRAEDAARIATRLQQALSLTYQIQGREVHSTASIGIVTSDVCLEKAETIVRNADVAMYEAKHAGRACSVAFNDAMHTRLSRHLQIETALRKALAANEFTLVYQPIVELDTGKRSSVEALIRWRHPALGSISPAEFVPIAEDSGLIIPMGEWVMRESLAALARWQAMDPDKAPRVVSVNVSRAELAQGPRLLKRVRAALQSAGLPPQSLQLEVTEREVMRDPQASLVLMNQLREIGVRLAMDDFGTGTSSLGCLSDYPFDVIKIDRSFITRLQAGPDTLAVIHATITLVENLGKCSVGEGVETAEQLAILQSMGCHYAQGYFLGRPQPEAEVVETERTIIAPRMRTA
jgi:diguanylate cyclase (GGDEF)-like protein/PAS domain S-box-containing protein